MDEQQAGSDRFEWRFPAYVLAVSTFTFVALMAYSAYGDWLYMFLVIPIVFLICLLLLVGSAIWKKPSQLLSAFLMLVAFLALSAALIKNAVMVRASVRWLLWSHRYKAELMAQPVPPDGQLRHIEWQATGFAGVANSTLYLVFDPTDSLAKARPPGKFRGIPSEVPSVHRLERHWYAVLFYTDEAWGERNQLNCSGLGT